MERIPELYVISIPIVYLLWVLFFSFAHAYGEEIDGHEADADSWGVMIFVGIPFSVLWFPLAAIFLIIFGYKYTVYAGMKWLVYKLWSEK